MKKQPKKKEQQWSTHIRVTLPNRQALDTLKIIAIKQQKPLATFIGDCLQDVITAYKE